MLCQIVGVTPLRVEVDKMSATELSAKMAKRIREDSCSTEFEDLDEYMSDDEPDAKPLTGITCRQNLGNATDHGLEIKTGLDESWQLRCGKVAENREREGNVDRRSRQGLKTLTHDCHEMDLRHALISLEMLLHQVPQRCQGTVGNTAASKTGMGHETLRF